MYDYRSVIQQYNEARCLHDLLGVRKFASARVKTPNEQELFQASYVIHVS